VPKLIFWGKERIFGSVFFRVRVKEKIFRRDKRKQSAEDIGGTTFNLQL